MNVYVVLAHPTKGSFNHAIAEAACEGLAASGHRLYFHDLYAEKFDCVLPGEEIAGGAKLPGEIKRHCDEIASADGIVIVHPNWWGQPPAILKGWIDRVLRVGVAYKFAEGDSGEGIPIGLLKAKAALVFNTSNTPAAREREVFGDPLEMLWRTCILELCGVREFHRRMFGVVITRSDRQRKAWLDETRQLVRQCFPPGL